METLTQSPMPVDGIESLVPDKEVLDSQQQHVAKWQDKVRNAKKHWKADFKRMQEDMEFAAGIQWPGQKDLQSEDRYIANLTLRAVSQKVATLYAKNPTVTYKRRERMDYVLWDGTVEQIAEMLQRVMMSNGQDVEATAVLQDFKQGQDWRKMLDKLGTTLSTAFNFQMDAQVPTFKTQTKQLVRRAIICGVGYVEVALVRSFESLVLSTEGDSSLKRRATLAQGIQERLDKGEISMSDEEASELRSLLKSVTYSAPEVEGQPAERLVFDFPPSTSIIPDPGVRSLKGFVNGSWVVREFILPIDEVNAFFEVKLDTTGENKVTTYCDEGSVPDSQSEKDTAKAKCCLWRVDDLTTKTRFWLVDGHKDFVSEPEVLVPCVKGFWTTFALTFNDVEVETGKKVSVFPPSDVRLMMNAQKEYNRARQGLREHREANAPKYMTGAGWLTDEDKAKINGARPHQVIEIQGAPASADVNKLLVPFQHASFDPMMYEVGEATQDIMMTTGQQEANLGQPTADVTATGSTIAEQSRVSVSGSNIDDLDEMLSAVAEAGGEMMLRGMSKDTIVQIAGRGAVFPQFDQSRLDFVNEVYLETEAGSSGRPNKALEVANFERIAPFLMQAGASPKFIVQEGLRRLDDQLDVTKAFPLVPPQGMVVGGQPSPTSPAQPVTNLPTGGGVPLAGH